MSSQHRAAPNAAPKHADRSRWTFRSFMAAVFWAFVTFASGAVAYTAAGDPAQQWGGFTVAVVAFLLLACKVAGARVRDVPGAVRRSWRW